MPERNPNGSVDALASAFRGVIVEVVQPLRDDVKALEGLIADHEKRIADRIDRLETGIAKNTQAQLADHREAVANLLKK